MIELRFLLRGSSRVLQYRWRELHTLHEQLTGDSDWQDVPECEEGESDGQ